MMDLALELGQSVASLRRNMTEREFAYWHKYANEKSLPMRRIEFYFAQLALMIARGPLQGAEQMTIQDFLLVNKNAKEDEDADEDDEDIDVEEARAAFGYNPRNK